MRKIRRIETVGASYIWDREWDRESVEDTLKWNEGHDNIKIYDEHLPPEGRIIAGGCGLGRFVIHYRKRGYNIIGIDNSSVALTKLKKYDAELPVMLGDLSRLPFPDNDFDAYISVGVIEHFEDGPQEILREAYRVIKIGGKLLIDVPVDNHFYLFCERIFLRGLRKKVVRRMTRNRIIRKFFGRPPFTLKKTEVFDYYLYSKRELERFLVDTGFEVKATIPTCHAVGLWRALLFLRSQKNKFDDCWQNELCLNPLGRFILSLGNKVNPWLFPTMVMCIAEKQ